MEWYRVGRLVNTHGIKGEVRVLATTDFPEERFAPEEKVYCFLDSKQPKELTISHCRRHKTFYLLQFDEASTFTEVEGLKGHDLWIREEQLHDLDEGEFYYHEIRGLRVITADGQAIGTIRDIIETGANDVWVVKRSEPGKKDVLLPYIDDVVKKIDLEENTVVVELLEGLMDE
ncbi:ribosome maturation factor RimM [Aureibacillus halotolerans]|uniref:Ribosome maturation factor RimM n=1 Tax=Aureibacillus halotolerans TaxID=1508390 RepID=A0A4R6U9E1_9BACI|nr:ribosome maturation factor RimM [Aureibacillus halotolerans]TDQ42402.1 16S rRNA processing protein RimM [Aureibacillus halotolerans]